MYYLFLREEIGERGIPLDQPQPLIGMLSGNRFYGGACSRDLFTLSSFR